MYTLILNMCKYSLMTFFFYKLLMPYNEIYFWPCKIKCVHY